MNRSWKAFIAIVASLLCVIIVCLTINISITKITENIASENSGGQYVDSGNSSGGNIQNSNGDTAINQNNPTGVTDNSNQQQNNQQPSGGNVVTPQGGNNQTPVANPLSYSRAQLVSYYNSCMNKSYSQARLNVTKSERVSVTVGRLLLNGKQSDWLQNMANSIVAMNEKDETKSMSFTNGRASDGTSARDFVLPTNLTAAGVASHSVAKSGNGYKVVFTLVQERCDFTTMPPHNKSCAWPLDFREIKLGGLGEIKSCDFYYPGTKLTAIIDGNGRVNYAQIDMPLTVTNAKATGIVQEMTADISGTWVCKLNLSF